MCFPPKAGSTFLKKSVKKWSCNKNASKIATWSLHFRCKFATRSVGHSFFAFRSASAERNENHKNQVRACFVPAGRNAQGRWGRFWGGLRELGLRFNTPALVYDKGGGFNRSAHSARPSHEQWAREVEIHQGPANFDWFSLLFIDFHKLPQSLIYVK